MGDFFQEILGGAIRLSLIPSGPPGTTTNFIINLLTNGLILMFTIVIVIAIVYAVLAGLKYIQSQGESDKVEEAQNALKSVFIGVLVVFVGVVIVVVIAGIFTNQSADRIREAMCSFVEPTSPLQECIEASSI